VPVIFASVIGHKRNERRRKRNAKKRNDRGVELPCTVALNILEHATKNDSDNVDVTDFPRAASAFVGRNDSSDTCIFTDRGLSSTPNSAIDLDEVTVGESLSKLDPGCPTVVRNLIMNQGYKYIVNDIRYVSNGSF